ncbi:MAG: hypothetical protein A2V66_11805 [Ignavibacteria bacterium RBG_13_36_8]|nr:MAG: hypothetical protein A2V66_11805 [Ignavibacteria bacterium RBG_13_36_8]
MSDKELTKEQLLVEIESLRNRIAELESSATGNNIPAQNENMTDLINNIMHFAGFDISNLQYEFLNTMINNIPNPVYYTDQKGIYLGCNKSYESFVGSLFSEIKGKNISEILCKEDAEGEKKRNKELLKSVGLISYETKFDTKNLGVRDIFVSKSIFKNLDGSIAGIIGVINDVTEKRVAERALVDSEKKLREAIATKDKFFSIISHDLKSPFVTLLGFTEMLAEDYEGFTEEERKDYIKDIQDSARRSFSLMENLLQWSSSQRGEITITPEEINFKNLISEAVNVLEGLVRQKAVTFNNKVEESTIVLADKNTLSYALRNLISNALKFNKNGGDVTVTAKPVGDYLEVAVEDTGIGLIEEDVQKLFRLDIAHKKIGKLENKSSGLGLILCKEFIERNGGKIWVESQLDKGSKFIFTIPLTK